MRVSDMSADAMVTREELPCPISSHLQWYSLLEGAPLCQLDQCVRGVTCDAASRR